MLLIPRHIGFHLCRGPEKTTKNTPYLKFSLFFFLVVGGSQGVPKIILTRFCKMIFLIKEKTKKYFCTGCQEISGMGCKKIF